MRNGIDTALHGHGNAITMGLDATLNLSGFDSDVIDASGATDADVLALNGRFDHDQLWFVDLGGDLVISVIGSERSVTVADRFDSAPGHHSPNCLVISKR